MEPKFTVIRGNRNLKDIYEKLKWTPVYEDHDNIRSLFPIAMKTFASERRIRKMVNYLREREGITITYDRFMEEEKEEAQRREELKEMFQDDDRVVVLEPKDYTR